MGAKKAKRQPQSNNTNSNVVKINSFLPKKQELLILFQEI
jgi:hypothetical protein